MLEIFVVVVVVGVLFGKWWVSFQKSAGLTSRDVYKEIDNVPRAGGLIALVAASVGYSLAALTVEKAAVVLLVAFAVGLLGFVDDLRGVNEYLRVLGPLLIAFMLARVLDGVRLTIPAVGLFYGVTGWFSVLAIPIMSNAFNMLDPVNGFLPAANVVIALSLAAVAAFKGQYDAVYLLSIHAAASLALYIYNRYPAKTFNGNVGSYFLGASVSSIAVVYDLVAYLILAALPFVANGVLIIFSSGGVKSREKIERPTSLKNGVVYQNCSSQILSLVRITVVENPLSEYQIFKSLITQVVFTSIITVVTTAVFAYLKMPI